MTPRERAESLKKLVTVDIHQDFWDSIRQQIEQAILADRQTLQSELTERLNNAHRNWLHNGIVAGQTQCGFLYNFHREIQSVFAQQSQPEAGKPHAFQGRSDRWCEVCNQPDRAEIHKAIVDIAFQQSVIEAECNRRVLAEREACAKICDEAENLIGLSITMSDSTEIKQGQVKGYKKASLFIAGRIRARSNQPEAKPSLTPFDPSRSTCVREAKEEAEENAKKIILDKRPCGCISFTDGTVKECGQWHVMPAPSIDQSTRIATLQEWLATDAKIIQQLNESNNALSLKVAQLEKEKHELTQELSKAKQIADHCGFPGCLVCDSSPIPANRKA